ncbi:hypothetical protein Tco_1271059 [Tanacetum coccineum]
MLEDICDESNDVKEENLSTSDSVTTYTQEGVYAINNDQDALSVGSEERYVKVKVVEVDEIPRTISNVIVVRVGLMEEMDANVHVQTAT